MLWTILITAAIAIAITANSIAKEKSKTLNVCLKDLKLKTNVLIASIIRNSEVIIPSGLDKITVNDSVIVISTGQILDDLDDILE